jgi:hypothetical protein
VSENIDLNKLKTEFLTKEEEIIEKFKSEN